MEEVHVLRPGNPDDEPQAAAFHPAQQRRRRQFVDAHRVEAEVGDVVQVRHEPGVFREGLIARIRPERPVADPAQEKIQPSGLLQILSARRYPQVRRRGHVRCGIRISGHSGNLRVKHGRITGRQDSTSALLRVLPSAFLTPRRRPSPPSPPSHHLPSRYGAD